MPTPSIKERKALHRLLDDATIPKDPIERLGPLAALVTTNQDLMVEAVAECRDQGHSWTTIGTALGISRQAARQRFGPGGSYDVEQLSDEVARSKPSRHR